METLGNYGNWLESCKNLEEVKKRYPNPGPDDVVYLEEHENINFGESYVAVVENGKWTPLLMASTMSMEDAEESMMARLARIENKLDTILESLKAIRKK